MLDIVTLIGQIRGKSIIATRRPRSVVARWVGWVVDGRVFEGGFWGCALGLCLGAVPWGWVFQVGICSRSLRAGA